MASFYDCHKKEWFLDIKTRDVTLVERLVKDANGNPIDLLAMADTGNLYQLYGNSRKMIDVVFVCLLDQIKTEFNEAEFDKTHELEASIMPELRDNTLARMGVWFGERLDGSAIMEMTEAFKEALLNFTRNPQQREALLRVLENQRILEEKQAQRVIRQSDDRLAKFQTGMDALLQEELSKTPDDILAEVQRAAENLP